jgi:hypothetical protein
MVRVRLGELILNVVGLVDSRERHLNEEVNGTEPSPSVSIPRFKPQTSIIQSESLLILYIFGNDLFEMRL